MLLPLWAHTQNHVQSHPRAHTVFLLHVPHLMACVDIFVRVVA